MRLCLILALLVVAVSCQTNDNSYNSASCGRRNVLQSEIDTADKIVGGTVCIVGDHAWIVELRYNGGFICGASLINTFWVATAAHCTDRQTASLFSLRIGLHNRNSPESWVQTRSLSKFVQHPSYASSTTNNDITMMKMSSSVAFRNEIVPICIPHQSTINYVGQSAIASGWGATASGGAAQTTKRCVTLPIISQTTCAANLRPYTVFEATMICAANVGDGLDTCQGDSGGPLVTTHPDGRYYLVGITSWGVGCGNTGVYTRVTAFTSWMISTMNAGF
jgi:trypsin